MAKPATAPPTKATVGAVMVMLTGAGRTVKGPRSRATHVRLGPPARVTSPARGVTIMARAATNAVVVAASAVAAVVVFRAAGAA